MLSRFLKHQAFDRSSPRVPQGSRIYAVGDVHGSLEALGELHHMIHEDAWRRQARRNVVVYLGDYIDRGEGSRAVLDLLIEEPLPGFERIHLLGNHEDSLLRFFEDVSIGPSWLLYGGDATLRSYGVRPPASIARSDEWLAAQRLLAERLPRAHLDFLRRLRMVHTEGDYFFVHAGVRPGVPLQAQQRDDLLWIREEFLRSEAEFGKIVVHGHSISPEPDVRRNRIGIDTGAFASGQLTCLVLEGEEWSFLQTAA